ncbi:MAG: GntR family transcriptional regulator [Devosia sp.]
MKSDLQPDLQISRRSATLRVAVEDTLRRAIATGVFLPGQRLIERELCELTGVGRTSIREALRQLEAEGLITTYPHRGPVVTVVTYKEAIQLYEIRAVLESFAGQEFAHRGSPQAIERLGAAADAFATAADRGDKVALVAAKSSFYDCLMEGSGNVFVRQMLTGLHNRITQLRVTSMTQPGRLEHSVREIRDIVSAIKDRNAQRAAMACKYHVEMASRVALEYLRQNVENESAEG